MATVFLRRPGDHMPGDDLDPIPCTTPQMMPGVQVCSFCGESNAEGFWYGEKNVSCCRRCALETLSALQADALIGERGHGELA